MNAKLTTGLLVSFDRPCGCPADKTIRDDVDRRWVISAVANSLVFGKSQYHRVMFSKIEAMYRY